MEKIKEFLKDLPLYGVCKFDGEHLIECRNKRQIPQNSQSIIMVALPYLLPESFYEGRNLSRYAVVGDYHEIFKAYLERVMQKLKKKYPEEDFVCFTDNSPIYEVESAVKSGLGVRGDNGLLITSEYGSWVFLGEIVTTLKLEANEQAGECIHCGACKNICPFVSENKKENCISAISQKKGELTQEESDRLYNSKSIWGCDLCQEVCPMNKNKKYSSVEEFLSSAKPSYNIGDSLDTRAYAWRGQAVIERNAKIVGKEK